MRRTVRSQRSADEVGALAARERFVERPEREMAGRPRDFEHQAIAETRFRPRAELPERTRNDIAALEHELLVREQMSTAIAICSVVRS
jgi:hypothetical protein